MNKPLIIYHKNCADGFTAAWCFFHKYQDNADYIPGVYANQLEVDVTNRDVYLVDFSYSRATVADMVSKAKSVTLIDHHKSALEDLAGLDGLIQFTDLNRSGAMLAWNFLFPDTKPPLLVQYVQDRDLWKFELAGSRKFAAGLFSYPYDFTIYNDIATGGIEFIKILIDEGSAIERKHHKDIDELLKVTKRIMVIGGIPVPVANLPYTMSSDAGHQMAKGFPFAACYIDTEKGRVFSLRSSEDGYDVSEIAKQYGGGGHYHAAGFTVPRNHDLAIS
jgi:oligoribonuclease NrnB/cAMP/cGMP phosphodiesterase (DHH superfamily)